LRRTVAAHPEVRLTTGAAAVRPEAVRLVATLRNAARVGWLRKPISEARTDGALQAIRSAALGMEAAGLLTEREVGWLMGAMEADQETFAAR